MLMGIKFKAILQAVVPLNMDDAAPTLDSVKAEFDFLGFIRTPGQNNSQAMTATAHKVTFAFLTVYHLLL